MNQSNSRPKRPAVFLDKDGTLVPDVPYNVDPRLIELAPRCEKGLRALAGLGYQLLVVSNQSGVARGLFEESALTAVIERIDELLTAIGVRLGGFYYCPHLPSGKIAKYAVTCRCRKPEPGLLQQAAQDLDLDLARSWMIGDILDDVEAGLRAGCSTVLIDAGNENEWRGGPDRRPHFIAPDINTAAEIIAASTPTALVQEATL